MHHIFKIVVLYILKDLRLKNGRRRTNNNQFIIYFFNNLRIRQLHLKNVYLSKQNTTNKKRNCPPPSIFFRGREVNASNFDN